MMVLHWIQLQIKKKKKKDEGEKEEEEDGGSDNGEEEGTEIAVVSIAMVCTLNHYA